MIMDVKCSNRYLEMKAATLKGTVKEILALIITFVTYDGLCSLGSSACRLPQLGTHICSGFGVLMDFALSD
jgi:hypothetical protein